MLVVHEVQYVDLEIFVIKIFLWFSKYLLQRIITSTKIVTVSTFSHMYIESGFQVQLTGCLEWHEMALLRDLQSRDGLPDPRGPLSSTIPAKGLLK